MGGWRVDNKLRVFIILPYKSGKKKQEGIDRLSNLSLLRETPW